MAEWTRLEPIGSGSTGEVWRVHDSTGRVAALKQAVESGVDSQRRSLKAEAAALARLNHPHIPTLLDSDFEAERLYLVMTLAEGEALNVLIASGALWEHPLNLRLDALAALADAVTHIHNRGMIHRDIKPSNMRGLTHPLLLDFGLACDVGAIDDPNAGTYAYMPPVGELPSPAADRYAFAVSVYHLLFGAHPTRDHHRKTYQAAQDREADAAAIASGDWRRPTLLPPSSIPGDLRGADLTTLEALFIPAFSADVSARPSDLRAWVAEIAAVLGWRRRTPHGVSVQEGILNTGIVGTPNGASAQNNISNQENVGTEYILSLHGNPAISADEIPFIPPPALPDFTAQQAAGFDDTKPPVPAGWWARIIQRLKGAKLITK